MVSEALAASTDLRFNPFMKYPEIMRTATAPIAATVRPIAIGPPELATIALDDEGLIQDCSSTCEQVFGYPRAALLGRHISLLVPKLEGTELVKQNQINPRLAFLCHCAIPFRARQRDGNSFASQLFFNRLDNNKSGLRMIIRGLKDMDLSS
jgi:PAS domain S-box-containing protein